MTTHRQQELDRAPVPLQTMATVRDEIDRIDDAMLELVEKRVSMTRVMAKLKNTDETRRLMVRPRREVEVVARLTGRARLADTRMVEHIWRTLMAYGLQDQAPMQLVLYADATTDRLALFECARARFGPAATLRWAVDQKEALNAARETEAIAILTGAMPPDLGDPTRAGDESLRVFETITSGNQSAYAIGRVADEDMPEPSR